MEMTLEEYAEGKEELKFEFLEWLRLYTGYDTVGKKRPEGELKEIYDSFIEFQNRPISYAKFQQGMWSYYVQERQLGNITDKVCEDRLRGLEEVIPDILEVNDNVPKEQTFGAWKRWYLQQTLILPANAYYKCRRYYRDEILPEIQKFIECTEVRMPIDEFFSIIEKVYTRKDK